MSVNAIVGQNTRHKTRHLIFTGDEKSNFQVKMEAIFSHDIAVVLSNKFYVFGLIEENISLWSLNNALKLLEPNIQMISNYLKI